MGSENTEGFTMTTLKITLDDGDMIITKFNGTAEDYLRYCGGIFVITTMEDDGEHARTTTHKVVSIEEAAK